MDTDIRQMESPEIEVEINELEVAYAEALANNSEVHFLNVIWHRIKELKRELIDREASN
jgi:hypothetical protein